jgi:chromosome partitioning protein
MPIISLLGNKGGAGKTTLAVNLASALHSIDSTLLLDADPQQSSSQWRVLSSRADSVPVFNASSSVAMSVGAQSKNYQHLLIDCPPSVHSDQTKDALRLSDWAIIPVLPSPLDLWASVKIEAEINKARESNPSLKALLVINQLEPRTRLSQAIRNATVELNTPTAETAIRRRVIYRSTILEGRSVFEAGAKAAPAVDELTELLQEIGITREQQ